MVRTCVVNCNSSLAIDIATYLVMRFCRRDGATSPARDAERQRHRETETETRTWSESMSGSSLFTMPSHHQGEVPPWSSHVCVWFVQTIGDVQEDSVNYVISIVLVLGAFQKDVGSHSKELTEHVETALSLLSRKA